MSEYTVYRMAAIKVDAESRKEAIEATKEWTGESTYWGSDYYFDWDCKSQLISAFKSADSFYNEEDEDEDLDLGYWPASEY